MKYANRIAKLERSLCRRIIETHWRIYQKQLNDEVMFLYAVENSYRVSGDLEEEKKADGYDKLTESERKKYDRYYDINKRICESTRQYLKRKAKYSKPSSQ